jgi:hypothetical protein
MAVSGFCGSGDSLNWILPSTQSGWGVIIPRFHAAEIIVNASFRLSKSPVFQLATRSFVRCVSFGLGIGIILLSIGL